MALPPSPAPGADAVRRDRFLDLVRAVAVVRVVTWHAFGAPVLTWLVAAMPAMFFVTGSLYGRSLDRHGARTTLEDRLRRIAPSLWVFAAVAWVAMAVGAARSGTPLDLRHALLWIVPVADPAGTVWEGGWLATPLWYLRTLLWLFLLAPLLVAAVRRWPRATFAVGALALAGLEVLDRSGAFRPAVAERIVWQLGDLVLYGLFFLLGVRAGDGAFAGVGSRRWLAVAGLAAACAGVWWATQPVPLGVVNNSHPLHLFVGLVWLSLALAGADHLRRAAEHPAVAPVVGFVGRRSLTVYLWHTAAIAVALVVLDDVASGPLGWWTPTFVVLVVAAVLAAVALFGWVEDLGARRPPRLWPIAWPAPGRRWPAVAGALGAALLVVGTLAQPPRVGDQLAFRPPVPSRAPPAPDFAVEPEPIEAMAVESDWSLDDDPGGPLEDILGRWVQRAGFDGVTVAVATPTGARWSAAVGLAEDGTPRGVDDPLDVGSVTKIFTANLVFRAAESGLLDLDAPLPALDAVPDFPHGARITPRQLLSHTSGLLNYWDSDTYLDNPFAIVTPLDAVRVAAASPLVVEPGTVGSYSSTNYLLLGLLLEQVTGRPFADLLHDELLKPLGLSSARVLDPEPGLPRTATGGLVADAHDLVDAGLALLRDHVGIGPASYLQMMQIDPDSAMGSGAQGYCPCGVDEAGVPWWFAVGYAGGHTIVLYLPEHDLSVAVDVTGSFWDDHGFEKVNDLVRRLARAVPEWEQGSDPAGPWPDPGPVVDDPVEPFGRDPGTDEPV